MRKLPPRGLTDTVIPVTPVTNKNPSDTTNYNIPNNLTDNLYRLYKGSDKWACSRCTYTGDKWNMLEHICKNDKKK
jgi:hypothetical protein